MNDELAKNVQTAIKEYIDNVGGNKILERTLEKLDGMHKEFIANIYMQVKTVFKDNGEIKITFEEIKKKKGPKKSSKEEKINFSKKTIEELVNLLKRYCVLDEVVDLYKNFLEEVAFIESWNIYEQWFGWALDNGEGSYLATHISKLTHSSSKGSSIDVRYFDSCKKYSGHYIHTNKDPILDTAYPDNKYSSISQLYSTNVDGFYIGDLLRNDGREYLCAFTNNQELLSLWVKKFSEYIRNDSKNSFFLTKQIYFPIQGRKYHLLMPLTSSSLVHELHLEHKKYWNEDQENARKQRSNKKYSPTLACTYPSKAYMHVTRSNPSNASSLNGKRGGVVSLLPAMPPQWRSLKQSYLNKTSLFDKTLSFELKEEIDDLRKYLRLIKNKSLSISEPKRNAAVVNKLRAISSQLFNYLETVNANEANEGWTMKCRLPPEEQLAFEPWRDDELAKTLKASSLWQKTLSQNYGRWLNQQLSQKNKLKLTAIHSELWSECFLPELREMVATHEVRL